MKYHFNVSKDGRKALVAAIGEIMGVKPRYLGAPGFAYEVGCCVVDLAGTVVFNECEDVGTQCDVAEIVKNLLARLVERGFTYETDASSDVGGVVEVDDADGVGGVDADDDRNTDYADGEAVGDGDVAAEAEGAVVDVAVAATVTQTVSDVSGKLVLGYPASSLTPAAFINLQNLVSSKSWILKIMAGMADEDELAVVRDSEYVMFPWFSSDAGSKAFDAYSRLVVALCETAKRKQRVSSAEKPVAENDNRKYKARCFLLSLEFIGGEYSQARKILLAPFEGNGDRPQRLSK